MIAGFEGDVGGAAAQAVIVSHPFRKIGGMDGAPSIFECDDFGMVAEIVLVPAFADDLASAVEDDAAHGGVGRGYADAAAG